MTITEVEDRVEQIRRASGDDEAAHGMQDDLYDDVLAAIAEGAPDSAALAAAALKVGEIKFHRWMA